MYLPPTPLRTAVPGPTGEQALAIAVLETAWRDLQAGRGSRDERQQLWQFLVVEGGSIWADLLGVDRAVIRQAAARMAPAPPAFTARALTCRECGAGFTWTQAGFAPRYCPPCRQARWHPSVHAEARRLAHVRTSRWPDHIDRPR